MLSESDSDQVVRFTEQNDRPDEMPNSLELGSERKSISLFVGYKLLLNYANFGDTLVRNRRYKGMPLAD